MDKSEECEIVWHNICGAFKIEDDGTNENIQHSNIGIFNHIIVSNSINGIIIFTYASCFKDIFLHNSNI